MFTSDAEKRVFTGKDCRGGLSRSARGDEWRSLIALTAEAGQTPAETEAILVRYVATGLVKRDDERERDGYWELVSPHVGNALHPSGG